MVYYPRFLRRTTKSVEYKVLDGAESTYEAETQEFALRAEGALEKFVSVEIDGKASTNIKVSAKVPATETVEEEVIEEDTENKDTNKPNNTKPDEEEKDGIPGYVWLILVVVLVVAGAAGVIWYRKNNESVSEE